MALLQDRINRMFEDAFPRAGDVDENLEACAWQPAVDIYDTDQGLAIEADLPGVKKEDVSVEIKDSVLTLSGNRMLDVEVANERYLRKERCFGGFSRSFNLEQIVDPSKVTAQFKNGVLKIGILNPEKEKPKKITVNID
jgi:HSP20 family protein